MSSPPHINEKNKKDSNIVVVSDTRFLEYVIAASVLGTCIGNIFLSRKMKSFKNMKSSTYTHQSYSRPHTYTETSSQSQQQRINHEKMVSDSLREFKESQRVKNMFIKWKSSSYKSERPSIDLLPNYLYPSLDILKLPKQIPSKIEIKEAFRVLALQVHPDRFVSTNKFLERKSIQEKEFQMISNAQNDLLNWLESQEKEK